MQYIVTYSAGVYWYLSKVSSEIQISNFGYLSSDMRICGYFSKPKVVREQISLISIAVKDCDRSRPVAYCARGCARIWERNNVLANPLYVCMFVTRNGRGRDIRTQISMTSESSVHDVRVVVEPCVCRLWATSFYHFCWCFGMLCNYKMHTDLRFSSSNNSRVVVLVAAVVVVVLVVRRELGEEHMD